MNRIYLYLFAALFSLIILAAQVYTDRGDPLWGFIACASWILVSIIKLEDST